MSGMQIADCRLQNWKSGIWHPASGIRYLDSGCQMPDAQIAPSVVRAGTMDL